MKVVEMGNLRGAHRDRSLPKSGIVIAASHDELSSIRENLLYHEVAISRVTQTDAKAAPSSAPVGEGVATRASDSSLPPLLPFAFRNLLRDYEANKSRLPAVGSKFAVKFDTSKAVVDAPFTVIGYDMSIPTCALYVSYGRLVRISTLDGEGWLRKTFIGAEAIVDPCIKMKVEDESSVGVVFGDKNPYSVPSEITLDDGSECRFIGHNMTLSSDLCLNWTGEECSVHAFDCNGNSRWSNSMVRQFLKAELRHRFEETVRSAMMPVVNRTWVHESRREGVDLDGNGCELTADELWLPSCANVNCTGEHEGDLHFPDARCDMSSFTGAFSKRDDIWRPNDARMKRFMKGDGAAGSAGSWWLRSASPDDSVALVDTDGVVDIGVANRARGIAPAFTIC